MAPSIKVNNLILELYIMDYIAAHQKIKNVSITNSISRDGPDTPNPIIYVIHYKHPN